MIKQLVKKISSFSSLPEVMQRALLALQLPIVLIAGLLLVGLNWPHAASASGWLAAEVLALLAVGAAWLLRRHIPVWLMQATILLFVLLAMWRGVGTDGEATMAIATGVMAMLMVALSGGCVMACVTLLLGAVVLMGALWSFTAVHFGIATPLLLCAVLMALAIVVQLRWQVQLQFDAWQKAGLLLGDRERLLADFRRRNDGFRRMLECEAGHKSLQLQRANRELRDANKHLESFNYMVSHDIRASLRILDGLTKVLVEELHEHRPAAARQIVVRMQNSIGNMHGMVSELLRISTGGNAVIRRCKVDLSAMARELVRDLKTADPHRQVAVEIADNIHAYTQPDLMRDVLQNLLFNAWKFTARRSDARIAMGVVDNEDDSKVYYVCDNGVGFDMSRAAELFQPFKRLHTEQDYEGTGVGLAAVKHIIERHGGRVWAVAEPSRGAKLCFTLGEYTAAPCEEVAKLG